MKVKELIIELKKYDPESSVFFYNDYVILAINHVEQSHHLKRIFLSQNAPEKTYEQKHLEIFNKIFEQFRLGGVHGQP